MSKSVLESVLESEAKSRIQVATVEQADEIADLVNGAYRGESAQQGWTTEASILTGLRTDAERVRALITAPGNTVLVKMVGLNDESRGGVSNDLVGQALDEMLIEGCVHLEKKDANAAYLGMLTTRASSQAKGTGSELLRAAEEYVARVWQMKKIEMTVIDSRHELIAYYVRRGYHVTNEKRPFPDDPRFRVPIKGPIEFVVLEKHFT